MPYAKQVDPTHYNSHNYDSRQRFISYYNQKDLVMGLVKGASNARILEIGKGNGFFSTYITQQGLNIKTFDLDSELRPDYVGDVLHLADVVREKFDIVCAFEILEHIRYEDVSIALKQMSLVTDKYVVISVPQSGFRFSLWMECSHYFVFKQFFQLPALRKANFTGEHYWELARPGYGIAAFRELLAEHFRILREFTEPLNSHHRFYILEKDSK